MRVLQGLAGKGADLGQALFRRSRKVHVHRLSAERIDLEPAAARTGAMNNAPPHQGAAHTQDSPGALGRIPDELTRGIHFGSQIDNISTL